MRLGTFEGEGVGGGLDVAEEDAALPLAGVDDALDVFLPTTVFSPHALPSINRIMVVN